MDKKKQRPVPVGLCCSIDWLVKWMDSPRVFVQGKCTDEKRAGSADMASKDAAGHPPVGTPAPQYPETWRFAEPQGRAPSLSRAGGVDVPVGKACKYMRMLYIRGLEAPPSLRRLLHCKQPLCSSSNRSCCAV